MANAFLNTGMATSNPQANVNQANNQVAPNMPNNGLPNNTQSQINPITIPIQIQPQIGQTQPINNIQPANNLQVNNNQQSNYNAPTPQPYQNNNAHNNVVDFNQIYSAYQGIYGNNPSNSQFNNTGIKKTSIGTTIVTPTTNNFNSVEGQYQSAYSDTINGIIGQMISNMNNGFEYDPTKDSSLKVATEYSANATLQSLAGSGVLNSSATAERVARIVSELIPQYEEKAHNRWIEYLGQLADTAQLVMNFDNQQFQYWKDAKDREFQEKEFEYNKEQKELENAWKRVDELGYVDNKASTILGVKVGTLSASAREAKEQREFELAKMREQYQLEYQNNKAIAELKNALQLSADMQMADYNAKIDKNLYSYKANVDTTKSKELAKYNLGLEKDLYGYKTSIDNANSKDLAKYNLGLDKELYGYKSSVDNANSKDLALYNLGLDKDLYSYKSAVDTSKSKELAAYQNSLNNSSKEYEYQLAQKYGTSNTSNNYTNYSTHDDIIQSRWGIQDIVSGKVTIRDDTTDNNDAVYNYLANAYATGRISQKDFAALIAKYGVTVPTQKKSSSTTTQNSNYGSNSFGYGSGGGFR